jgi:hypothetical protein
MCSILSLTRGDNPDKQNKGMNKMTTLTSVIKKELKQCKSKAIPSSLDLLSTDPRAIRQSEKLKKSASKWSPSKRPITPTKTII